MRVKWHEFVVGLFIIAAIVALIILAFKVSGLTDYVSGKTYTLKANFENIGGLTARAPVKVAGVKIGQVTSIDLNSTSYEAVVSMEIEANQDKIPKDSTAQILTAGLLGSNFIGISPGYSETMLKPGATIVNTTPAIQLENMIGQFMLNSKGGAK